MKHAQSIFFYVINVRQYPSRKYAMVLIYMQFSLLFVNLTTDIKLYRYFTGACKDSDNTFHTNDLVIWSWLSLPVKTFSVMWGHQSRKLKASCSRTIQGHFMV